MRKIEPQPDDNEPLCTEWIKTIAAKAPHTWEINGTNLFLYQSKPTNDPYSWEFCEVIDDGDETTWCSVRTRGELRRMIALHCGIAASIALIGESIWLLPVSELLN